MQSIASSASTRRSQPRASWNPAPMAWPWTAATDINDGSRSQANPSWQAAIQSSKPGSAGLGTRSASSVPSPARTRRERQLDEMDPFNQMLAVIETRAHLELLTAQGRLSSTVQDGIVYYEVPAAP